MKIAVIGSRIIQEVSLDGYLCNAKEIVSGGAKGVDTCAAKYAENNGIKLTVFLPQFARRFP